jgi:DNA-binding transcriptional LysR family regulator
LRLTEAGKEVVAAAARIDNVMSDLLDTLRGTNELLTARVRISLVSTGGKGSASWLPDHSRAKKL